MRGMAVAGLAVALMLAMTGNPAAAQWMHLQGEDDPFAGGVEHTSMTLARHGEIIGFRCTSAKDLAFLFVSTEKPQADHVALMSLLTARLLVIIADEPQREYVALIDTTPDGDRYRFTALARTLPELVKAAGAAKRRLAVAVEIKGERVHSAAVNVRGSGRAIRQLVKGCGLP